MSYTKDYFNDDMIAEFDEVKTDGEWELENGDFEAELNKPQFSIFDYKPHAMWEFPSQADQHNQNFHD